MRFGLTLVGTILFVVGIVWTGQGANLIGGSFMTGQRLWLITGMLTAAIGAALVWWATIGYRRFP